MKVLKTDAIPAEPAKSPLFTGGAVTRQTLLTPEMSNSFNLAVVNFSPGARKKMHIHSSDQVPLVTAGKGIIATESEREIIAWETSCTFRREKNTGTAPRLSPRSPTLH